MAKMMLIQIGILISISIFGQQHVEPYMIQIPSKTILYESNGVSKNKNVTGFYISQYPESIQQYKEYLKELNSSGKILIKSDFLPKVENLKQSGLDQNEIDFLINDYFTKSDYDEYPIIGLDYGQITRYLDWKSNHVGLQLFRNRSIDFPDSLSYLEVIRMFKDSFDIPAQHKFLVPLEVILISAFEEKARIKELTNLNEKAATTSNNDIIKQLNINNIYHYGLHENSNYNNLDELIYDYKGSREVEVENQPLKILKLKKEKEYETTFDKTYVKPWRVWNIKF